MQFDVKKVSKNELKIENLEKEVENRKASCKSALLYSN